MVGLNVVNTKSRIMVQDTIWKRLGRGLLKTRCMREKAERVHGDPMIQLVFNHGYIDVCSSYQPSSMLHLKH
mgnify:CR=1 FL=1